MSRSRGAKRPVGGTTKCNSPSKKRRTAEQNNEMGLPNADRSLPFGIKFSKKGESNSYAVIDINSKNYQKDVQPIIDASFKNKSKSATFEVLECRDLRNLTFEREYSEKRRELRQNGISKEATADQYGFLFSRLEVQVKDWCQQGIRSGNVRNSRLGKPESGVNLAQYVDVICPTNLLPREGWVCVVKYFKGRVYHAHDSANPLEPQPSFDCHMPNFKSNSSWNRGNADTFFSNQIYLYEYTEECVPRIRPRHVLPFFALRYQLQQPNRMGQNLPDTSNINRYRLALQRDREDRANAAGKPSLANRQHPGVPLLAIKPKPPPLISQSIRQVTKHRLSISSGGTASPLTPGAATGCIFDGAKPVYDCRRASTENSVPDACAIDNEPTSKKNITNNVQRHQKRIQELTCEADKQEKDVEDERKLEQQQQQQQQQQQLQQQQADERQQPTHTMSHQRQKHSAQSVVSEKPLQSQQRPERPNPNIGMKHFSTGYIVSFLKLKAGDYFQAKMDLVSYADNLTFPLPVLYMRLSPKLSIRKFVSMSRLRSVELAGADVSIKKEFLCQNCNRYAAYYRLYIRQNSTGNVEMSKLCDYMRRRETVGVVHFTTESQEMLMFPDSDFSKSIGIPQFENTSTDSPLFLHCLLMSPQPKIDYYRRLLHPVVSSEDQLLDEVLRAYIWEDAEIPPLDEEETSLLGSYGGEWPTEEAVEQVFKGENEIQHRCLLQSFGRGPSNPEPIVYRAIKFHRRIDSPLDAIFTTEMLQTMLDNVAAAEARQRLARERRHSAQSSSSVATPVASEERCNEIEDEPGDRPCQNGGQSSRLTPSEAETVVQTGWTPSPTTPIITEQSRFAHNPSSPNEPATVAFTKCVFDEPPLSPCYQRVSVSPSERPVLVEMNPTSREGNQSNTKSTSTTRQARNAEISANMQQLRVGLDQHAPDRGENMTNSAGFQARLPPSRDSLSGPELVSTNGPLLPHAKNGSGISIHHHDVGKILSVIRSSMYTDTRRSAMDHTSSANQILEPSDSVDDDESQAFNAYEMQNRAAQEARERIHQPPLTPPSPPSPSSAPSPSSLSSSASLERSPIRTDVSTKMDTQWSYRPSDDEAKSTAKSPTKLVSAAEVTEEEIHRELEEGLLSSKASFSNGIRDRDARDESTRRLSNGSDAPEEPQMEAPGVGAAEGEDSPVAALSCPTMLASTHASSPTRLVRPSVPSPGLAGRRDHRFLRKSSLLPARRSSSPHVNGVGVANGIETEGSPPASPLKTLQVVRNSVLPAKPFPLLLRQGVDQETSVETPEDCVKPGIRIPVMVGNRRNTTPPQQSQPPTSVRYGDCLPGVYRMPVPVPVGVPMSLSLPVAPTPASATMTGVNGTATSNTALTLLDRDSSQVTSVTNNSSAGVGGCDMRIWQP